MTATVIEIPEAAAAAGGGLSISSISSGTASTVTDYDTMYIVDVGNAYSLTLPTAASQAGKTVDVVGKQAGSYAVTVITSGVETIAGSSANYLLTQNQSNLTLVSDGTNWVIR